MQKFSLRNIFILILITSSYSCNRNTISLDDFDQQAWKADRNGCSEKRISAIQSVINQKEKLLGLDELKLIKILGKPDRNELYKRNQKFYYYFVQPSSACTAGGVHNAQKLVIRFNAVGLAKEVLIE